MSYRRGTVLVPSVCMPLVAFENAYPRLLSSPMEILSDLEMRAISDCYLDIESFNRRLDYAHAAVEDPVDRAIEVERAHVKASHIIPGKYSFDGQPTSYDFAMAIVAARLSEP